MKLDQRSLEIMCLSAITKNSKCMDKVLARQITKEHFVYIEPNDTSSYTQKMYDFVMKYWERSGGSLLTGFVLESSLNESNIKDYTRRKYISLWDEIENFDFDENDFHEVSYRPESDRLRFTVSEAARVEVLRRLSELNRQRYQEEVDQGLHDSGAASDKRLPRSRSAAAPSQPSFDFSDAAADQRQHAVAAEPIRPCEPPTTAILDFLIASASWHSKAAILDHTKITEEQWNNAAAELISGGRLERKGEKRGTRYRAAKATR